MANNRIYLRCKTCGEAIFIGKDFGSEYFVSNEYYKNRSLVNSLNDFYYKHCWCYEKINKEYDFLEPKFRRKKIYSHENNFEIAYDLLYTKEDFK